MSQKICASAEQWKEVDARGLAGARQTKQTIENASAIQTPARPPTMPGAGP
jgi:hypothetical protein